MEKEALTGGGARSNRMCPGEGVSCEGRGNETREGPRVLVADASSRVQGCPTMTRCAAGRGAGEEGGGQENVASKQAIQV